MAENRRLLIETGLGIAVGAIIGALSDTPLVVSISAMLFAWPGASSAINRIEGRGRMAATMPWQSPFAFLVGPAVAIVVAAALSYFTRLRFGHALLVVFVAGAVLGIVNAIEDANPGDVDGV